MRVYIAGPYTGGDTALNVRHAIDAADICHTAGHDPYIPHLSHFWHLVSPKSYATWLAVDLVWLAQCEALVRLPGESPGADKEIVFAHSHNIPVYFGVDAFLAAQGRRHR